MAPRPDDDTIDYIDFVGSRIAIIRETTVENELPPEDALDELRTALAEPGRRTSEPRLRLKSGADGAWMHTLRARLEHVMGGKDYSSLGFDLPAMWVTVVDARTGALIALIEADYLSRVRTAAVTALATDVMAPKRPKCLVHFGAGKISRYLVELVLRVRPSIREVRLVRRDWKKGLPGWAKELRESGCRVRLWSKKSAKRVLRDASVITTATSSREPIIERWQPPRNRQVHINLVGSNHYKRAEIDEDLARRCLQGLLVVDDAQAAEREAGDFLQLGADDGPNWSKVSSLERMLRLRKPRPSHGKLTTFKSVGSGVMDLILAQALLRRLGLSPDQPGFDLRIRRSMAANARLLAFAQGARRLSFTEMEAWVEQAASWMRDHGVRRGDRVAVLTLNRIQTVAMEWATYRLGGIWLGVPAREGDPRRLESLLNDFTPSVFIYESAVIRHGEEVERALVKAGYMDRTEPPPMFDRRRYTALCPRVNTARAALPVRIEGERIVRIRYSSGASGDPKAVAYSARTSLAIIDQIESVILEPCFGSNSKRVVVVHVAPIVWAGGSLIAPSFLKGGKNVLLEKWSLEGFVTALGQHRSDPVLTFLTPGLVAEVSSHAAAEGTNWIPEKLVVIVAGGPLPVSTAAQALEVLPRSKVRLFTSLGQTEASFPITWHEVSAEDCPPENERDWFVPLGPLTDPYRSRRVRGDTELVLRGDAVAMGKWVRPASGKKGDWVQLGTYYRTGDLVRQRGGVLRYVGRAEARNFVVGGKRPAPEAVEALLDEHPGVVRSRLDYSRRAGRIVATLTVQPDGPRPAREALLKHFKGRCSTGNLGSFEIDEIRFSRVELTMSGKVKRGNRSPATLEGMRKPRELLGDVAPNSWKRFDFSRLARSPLYFYVGAGLSQAVGLVGWGEMADLVYHHKRDYEKNRRAGKSSPTTLRKREAMLDEFVGGLPGAVGRSTKTAHHLGRAVLLNLMLRYRGPRYPLFELPSSDARDPGRGRPGLEPAPEDLIWQSLIWRAGCHGVFTTNYDMLLENAFSLYHHGTTLRSYRYNAKLLRYLLSNRHFVLKLHGDVNDIGSMQFSPKKAWTERFSKKTRSDLRRVYKAALESGHMVYVGCGFSDDTIDRLESAAPSAGSGDRLRIALLPENNEGLLGGTARFALSERLTYQKRSEVVDFLRGIVDARADVDESWQPCLEASDIHHQVFDSPGPPFALGQRMTTEEWSCAVKDWIRQP